MRVQLWDNARHASAAAVNLTVTNPRQGGFVAVWPAGTPQPQVSSLNVEHPGQTIANFVIVPVSGGSIEIWTNTQADVIIDLLGIFTKADAPVSADGLFVALTPSRVFDTRDDPGGPLRSGWRRDVAITGRADIPADNVAAVLANRTATEASQATWLTAYPSGTSIPRTSTLNLDKTYQTLPNMMLSRIGTNGAISLHAQRTTHAIVDAVGYFTGPSAPGAQQGAPAEAAVFPGGRQVYVSNYSMYGPGAGPEGSTHAQRSAPSGRARCTA